MTQEFVIPASPQAARRLVKLAALSETQVDDGLRALAAQDVVTAEQLKALPLQIVSPYVLPAVQKLIDQAFRAVVCSAQYEDARQVVMAACHLNHERPLVIASDAPERWRDLALALDLRVGRDPRQDVDVLLLDRRNLVAREVIETRRDGVLVLETSSDPMQLQHEILANCQGVVNEFAKTVLLGNFGSYLRHGVQWPHRCDEGAQCLTALLHADAPQGLFSPLKWAASRGLRGRGFPNLKRAEAYELVGVITDLMGSQGPGD